MTFVLPTYCRALPEPLADSVELGSDDNGRQFRAADFAGLTAHEQLIFKLAILTARGTYSLQSEQA